MSETIKAIAPLSLEQLKQSLANKELAFEFDALNSKIKGRALINYMCNLEPTVDIDHIPLDYETRAELLLTWMVTRQIKYIKSFVYEVAEICVYDAIGHYVPLLEKQYFSLEEKKRFIADNKAVIDEWTCFIRSMSRYLSYALVGDSVHDLSQHENVCVDDGNIIGTNVVNLLFLPDFVSQFIAIDQRPSKFYVQQFTKPVFRGRPLLDWFKQAGNSLYYLIAALATGKLEFEQFAALAEGTVAANEDQH